MGGSQGGKACGGGEGRWWWGALVHSASAPGVHGRPRLPLKWEVSRVSASVCVRPPARAPASRVRACRCHRGCSPAVTPLLSACTHAPLPACPSPRLPLSLPLLLRVPLTRQPWPQEEAAGRRLLPPVHCCRVLLGTQVLLGIGLCRCLIPPGIPGGAGWTAQTTDSRGLFLPKVSAECSAGVQGWGGGVAGAGLGARAHPCWVLCLQGQLLCLLPGGNGWGWGGTQDRTSGQLKGTGNSDLPVLGTGASILPEEEGEGSHRARRQARWHRNHPCSMWGASRGPWATCMPSSAQTALGSGCHVKGTQRMSVG